MTTTYTVPSETTPGATYTVVRNDGGYCSCSCTDSEIRSRRGDFTPCKHIRKLRADGFSLPDPIAAVLPNIDPATGQLLGREAVPEEYTEKEVLTALEFIREAELELAAIAADRAARNAVYDEAERPTREWLAHLHRRHDAALRRFAEKTLAGGKRRSWAAPDGSGVLRIRTVPGRLQVVNEGDAVDWCLNNGHADAVVTPPQRVLTSKLAGLAEAMEGNLPDCLRLTPAGEAFNIDLRLPEPAMPKPIPNDNTQTEERP